MRNVNMNQFALPSMEEHAHPLARHLARGTTFHFQTDYTHGEGGQGPRQPYEHSLHAVDKSSQTLGYLYWAGSAQRRGSGGSGHYPGEVTWVSRATGDLARPHGTKGLMADLFHAGHQVNMGQSTVPVHSPDRSREGEAWSKKVGPPELRPKRSDFDWAPPPGIHPYERQGAPRQFAAGPMKGQQPLPGLEGHSHERSVDMGHVLKNWIR